MVCYVESTRSYEIWADRSFMALLIRCNIWVQTCFAYHRIQCITNDILAWKINIQWNYKWFSFAIRIYDLKWMWELALKTLQSTYSSLLLTCAYGFYLAGYVCAINRCECWQCKYITTLSCTIPDVIHFKVSSAFERVENMRANFSLSKLHSNICDRK